MKVNKKTAFFIIALLFVVFAFINYWNVAADFIAKVLSAASPIFVGLVIAYILNILMSLYERFYFPKSKKPFVQKSRRAVCLILAFITLLAIITAVIWLVIPELVSCIKTLISQVPPAIEKLLQNETLTKTIPENALNYFANINWQEHISKIVKAFTNGLGSAAETIFVTLTSVTSSIVTTLIGVVFSIYLLNGKEKLQNQCKRLMKNYLPKKFNEKLLYVLSVLNDSFHRYIVGQCTEAVILGILSIIGMLIFAFPYAVMIGTLIGFTAIIPIAGAYIGAIVGGIMILTVSPIKALLFIVFIIVLQQIEGNLIYPKIVGKSIGLPPIFVLTAITIGGGILGIGGMLIGVPIASAIYRLLGENIRKRESEHNKENNISQS